MWAMSHTDVNNHEFGEKLSMLRLVSDIFCLYHTSKFAPIGDMWKNHCN